MKTAEEREQLVALSKRFTRATRMSKRLHENDLELKYNKHLDRVSNVTFRNGLLYDGTCHYTHRYEARGNTYPVKDILKSFGFRWDRSEKVWWIPVSEGQKIETVSAALCRHFAESN